MTVETFDSSTTWECPPGVTSVDVECWGAGGGGSAVTGDSGAGANGRVRLTYTAATPPSKLSGLLLKHNIRPKAA